MWKRNWTIHRCNHCKVTRHMNLEAESGCLQCGVCGTIHYLKQLHHPPPGSTASESLPPTPMDPQREGSGAG